MELYWNEFMTREKKINSQYIFKLGLRLAKVVKKPWSFAFKQPGKFLLLPLPLYWMKLVPESGATTVYIWLCSGPHLPPILAGQSTQKPKWATLDEIRVGSENHQFFAGTPLWLFSVLSACTGCRVFFAKEKPGPLDKSSLLHPMLS